MKIIFFAILLTLYSFGCTSLNVQRLTNEEIENTINKAKSSKLIVLDVYHNRCKTCEQIEPVMKRLISQYENNPDISFLKYDLSNPFTINDSMKIAKALELEKIYKSQRYSGIVLFINPKTKEVTENLIGEYDIKKYTDAIQNILKDK